MLYCNTNPESVIWEISSICRFYSVKHTMSVLYHHWVTYICCFALPYWNIHYVSLQIGSCGTHQRFVLSKMRMYWSLQTWRIMTLFRLLPTKTVQTTPVSIASFLSIYSTVGKWIHSNYIPILSSALQTAAFISLQLHAFSLFCFLLTIPGSIFMAH